MYIYVHTYAILRGAFGFGDSDYYPSRYQNSVSNQGREVVRCVRHSLRSWDQPHGGDNCLDPVCFEEGLPAILRGAFGGWGLRNRFGEPCG